MTSLKNNFFIILVFLAFNSAGSEAAYYKFKGIVDVVKGTLFSEHYLEIKDGIIVKLTDKAPDSVVAVDYSKLYLSPGLIDSHSHIFVSQIIADGNFSNALMREQSLSKKDRFVRAKKYLREYVMEGFTSIFDLGNSGVFFDVELRDDIKKNKDYPSMFVSGPGLAALPGQFPKTATPAQVSKEYTLVDGKTDVVKLMDNYVRKHVDILKIYLDNYPGPGVLDESVLKKILNYTNIGKFKKITFHSFIPESGKLLRKYQIKNTEHFNFYMGEDFPKSLLFISPTNFDIDTMKQFHQYSASYYLLQQNVLKRLYKDRINILFGPDFYYEDQNVHDFNRAKLVKRTINSFIDAGFDPKEILKMMTYNPALSIGMQKRIGQIIAGSTASFIGTIENPLTDSAALKEPSLVMNRGKILVSK